MVRKRVLVFSDHQPSTINLLDDYTSELTASPDNSLG